jgi:hypothetical protein
MADDHMLLGFRIEFWDHGKPVAAAWCEDAYMATAVPRAGELVSSEMIAGLIPPKWLPIPFMKVTTVEHYPSKAPEQPATHVVIRLEAPGATLGDLRPLEAEGWTIGWFPTLGRE